ncbi:MAG: hypothetical protein ACFE85_05165 [Candidatus Hodarchaeota archaeon]
MEESSKQPEKTVNRRDLGVAVVLIIIGIFIMVGGIISHIALSPIGGQNVGLATMPIIASGVAIVIGSLIYPYRKRIKWVGCYCVVLYIIILAIAINILPMILR